MNRKMEKKRELMVLTCGSERIVIETNDLYSGDSEMSDSSSCLSDLDFEEIEIEQPMNVEKQGKEIGIGSLSCFERKEMLFPDPCVKLFEDEKHVKDGYKPNPYVKLVRCDHLVTKVFSDPSTEKTGLRGLRSSSRKRRNRTYLSGRSMLGDYSCNKLDQVHPFVRAKKKQKNKINKDSAISNHIPKFKTDLAENEKHNDPSDSTYNYNSTDINGMAFSSRLCSNDSLIQPSIAAIKVEPHDTDFDGTAYVSSFDSKFPTETDYKPVFPGQYLFDSMINNDMKHITVKQENSKESSDSEVDVERHWDGHQLNIVLNSIAFDHDHPYSLRFDSSMKSKTHKVNSSNMVPTKDNYPLKKQKEFSKNIYETQKVSSENLECINMNKEEEPKNDSINNNMSKKEREPRSKTHNRSERIRRAEMSVFFSKLKDEIPDINADVKASKHVILVEALKYIEALQCEETNLLIILRNLKAKRNKLERLIRGIKRGNNIRKRQN